MSLNIPLDLDERISFGISAYGNQATTRYCLRALLNSAQGNFELILVDDCSPDKGEIIQLFKEIAKEHKNTKIYQFKKNQEYSGSLNCILSHAAGDRVFFISNDIFVTPYYIQALLDIADNDPEVGIVRGVSNFVDNGKASHNLKTEDQIKHFDDILPFAEKLYTSKKAHRFMEEYLTGDAFLVKKELIAKIGTIDPNFYGYFADHDFGVRARRAGFKLAVAEGAFAFHHQDANFLYLSEPERQKKINARWAKVHENWARFKLKYGLPVEWLYPGINSIDWNHLSSAKTNDNNYVKPKDYQEHLMPL